MYSSQKLILLHFYYSYWIIQHIKLLHNLLLLSFSSSNYSTECCSTFIQDLTQGQSLGRLRIRLYNVCVKKGETRSYLEIKSRLFIFKEENYKNTLTS